MNYFLDHPLGFQVFFRHWAVESPRALVILAHGMGDHTGRYEPVAAFLRERSLAVMGADFPGFGQSSGKRGHATSLEAFYHTLDLVFGRAEAAYPGVPVFLMGQSMGGNIVMHYCLRQLPGVAGIIATSPWIRVVKMPPAITVELARLVRRIFPAFTQSNGLDPRDFSRDPAVVEAYRQDPYVHDRVSAGIGFSLLEAGFYLNGFSGAFHRPLLLTHGTKDALTDHRATASLAARVKSPVTLKLWEGLYHETHFEPEKQQVLEYLTGWIDQQIKQL